MSDNNFDKDVDPQETVEWLDALDSVLSREGKERAHFLIEKLVDKARRNGAYFPFSANTAYMNTIPDSQQVSYPGNLELEARIQALIRWNAMAMVVRANVNSGDLGGHIASFASSATLYDVGFNHFFHAPSNNHGGDLIYIQGHSSPGIYARSFLEGRFTDSDLFHFRRETGGKGLSSYPHPRLMPGYWQFPTVSMGLGPLTAIYQARYMKYLEHRGILNTEGRKVWAFLGDGEMDEPESLGAIALASREKLDNLIFVVNCNLQRLDGPVRGNSKIIQELEADFRGNGWNVIKVIWGSKWSELFAKDHKKLLRKRIEEVVDGDFQNYVVKGGGFVREHFFGKYPELLEMVANKSDKDIWHLDRGGHDPQKVYAAYEKAVNHKGQPTVILAKTIKGFGMGEAGEGQNITHSQKKMGEKALQAFRNRFNIPIEEDKLSETPFYRPPEDSPEMQYLMERREKLGGSIPQQVCNTHSLKVPKLDFFEPQIVGSNDRKISTTMAFVRILTKLLRDKDLGRFIVPIVPDEARTFGMEGLFRQIGIYSSSGQVYEPPDSNQVMYYREDLSGQILEEGINEAGAFSSWIAAGTAHCNHAVDTIPFYIFYSMFGFQRIGDLAWLAGDAGARGFLLGGTAGRTTLNGEGLQHQDGHSHIQASTIPSCVTYDPTYAYELAVIMQDGMRRMYQNRENVFYYITVMNENYAHPPMPEGVEEGIRKGLYLFKKGELPIVDILGSGTILREVLAAAELLKNDFGIDSNVWSATSFNELRKDGLDVQRYNMLHPDQENKLSHVEQCFLDSDRPVVAATDYMKAYADQIRPFVKNNYVVLGTDGYGRSDTREKLRKFFEVDRYYVALAVIYNLSESGKIPKEKVNEAIQKYKIDPEKTNPVFC